MENRKLRKRRLGPSGIIVIGFASLILLGALLLMLPVATEDGHTEPFLTCLFTATSASCVTGLVLVDTATNWSTFGELVILFLIQIGGLGFMTVAMMLSLLVKRRISPKERQLVAQSFNLSSYSGIIRLIKKVLIGTLAFESLGFVFLSIRFIPIFGLGNGLWKAAFTSVSAFCNAGFDLMGKEFGEFSSLTSQYADPVINVTVMSLIVIGGIGFVVWDELYALIRYRRKLSVYSRLVLLATAVLILFGTVVFAALEWNNSGTIGNLSVKDKIFASFFQSVTVRTAGFNTVDLCALSPITKLTMIFLMFIGGCSGSTAGGIKVGTFSIVFVSILYILMGRSDVIVFKRRISDNNVLRALAIVVLQFTVTLLGGIVIMSGGTQLLDAMFEAFSATGTVGLSLSVTGALNTFGKIAVILMMYFGRVGILTVSYAVLARLSESKKEFKNAEANVMVG